MSHGRRSDISTAPQPRALYLRITIDPDMGEAFTALNAISPRKRNREATYFLRRGIEKGTERSSQAPMPPRFSPTSVPATGYAPQDHLAGMPGIDD